MRVNDEAGNIWYCPWWRDFVTELVLIAGCGRHTDWAIGIGEAQRFSIMAGRHGSTRPLTPPVIKTNKRRLGTVWRVTTYLTLFVYLLTEISGSMSA
jgi:hypothetical protein